MNDPGAGGALVDTRTVAVDSPQERVNRKCEPAGRLPGARARKTVEVVSEGTSVAVGVRAADLKSTNIPSVDHVASHDE